MFTRIESNREISLKTPFRNGIYRIDSSGFGWLVHDSITFKPEDDNSKNRQALLLGYIPKDKLMANPDDLYDFLQRKAESSWSPLAGTRVSAREMEAFYVCNLKDWESKKLEMKPDEIWADPYIPNKIKRKLVLQKVGLPLDPHLFIPGNIAKDCLLVLALQSKFDKDADLIGFGASTASMSDRLGGRMPSLRVPPRSNDEKIQDLVNNYLREIELMCGNYWDSVMLHLYPNTWDDKQRVAGARLRLQTNITGSVRDLPPHFLEIISGDWPRKLDRSIPGKDHYFRQVGSVENNSLFGTITTNMNVTEMMPAENQTMISVAREKIDACLHNADFRAQISHLQQIVGTEDLTFDACFYIDPDLGQKLYWFDFDAAKQK